MACGPLKILRLTPYNGGVHNYTILRAERLICAIFIGIVGRQKQSENNGGNVVDIMEKKQMENKVSRKSIAEIAGVSKTTVTRVLNGSASVSEKTRQKILSVISECGYTHNKLAVNISSNKNCNFIAMLVPDMSNYYYLEMFNRMVTELEDYDYTISIYRVNKNNLANVLDKVIQNRVAAIINLAFEPMSEADLKKIRCANIKVIHPGIGDDPVKIKINYRPAMEKAFADLKENSADGLYFICGAGKSFAADKRLVTYLDLMRENGFGPAEDTIIWGDYPKISAMDAGYIACSVLIEKKEKIGGLFCLNDMMALGAVKALRDRGIKAGKDVKVVGFDNILLGQYSVPELSTVDSNIDTEAKRYVDHILGETDKKSSGETVIESVYVRRDSSR